MDWRCSKKRKRPGNKELCSRSHQEERANGLGAPAILPPRIRRRGLGRRADRSRRCSCNGARLSRGRQDQARWNLPQGTASQKSRQAVAELAHYLGPDDTKRGRHHGRRSAKARLPDFGSQRPASTPASLILSRLCSKAAQRTARSTRMPFSPSMRASSRALAGSRSTSPPRATPSSSRPRDAGATRLKTVPLKSDLPASLRLFAVARPRNGGRGCRRTLINLIWGS